MVTESIIVAISSTAAELALVGKIRFLRELLVEKSILSLVFSTGLSWLIGAIFGATGVTVMMAAMISTLATWFVYRATKVFIMTKQFVTI